MWRVVGVSYISSPPSPPAHLEVISPKTKVKVAPPFSSSRSATFRCKTCPSRLMLTFKIPLQQSRFVHFPDEQLCHKWDSPSLSKKEKKSSNAGSLYGHDPWVSPLWSIHSLNSQMSTNPLLHVKHIEVAKWKIRTGFSMKGKEKNSSSISHNSRSLEAVRPTK